MDSTRPTVSLNGVCITASSNPNTDSANVIPHYLRPYTGSCHDICKYGRRRAFEEPPAQPLHKRSPKLSIIVPTHRKKEVVNHEPSAVKPSPDAKSFFPRAKIHSPRRNTLSDAPQVVKRGVALPVKAQVQVRESSYVGSKLPTSYKRTCDLSASIRLKPVSVKPSPPSDSSDSKRTRNNDVESCRNTKKTWIPAGAPLSPNKGRKTARVELPSPWKDQKRVKRIKTDSSSPTSNSLSFQEEEDRVIKNSGSEIAKTDIGNVQPVEDDQTKTARTETGRNEFEFGFESVTDTTSSPSSSHGEYSEESDKCVVSQRKSNHNKRRRKHKVVKSGDKQSQPIKLKFRIGNSLHLHKENNVPRRHKFKRTRVDAIGADDSVSDKNKSIRIGSLKASRTKDKYHSSKNRRKRARYGKTRILVLEDKNRDSKRNYQENDDAAGAELLLRKKNLNHRDHHLQRKKDVQYLFNYVLEETASKLAERRKGMVKSLVGVFETLISQMNTQMLSGSIRNTHLQARKCFLRVAT